MKMTYNIIVKDALKARADSQIWEYFKYYRPKLGPYALYNRVSEEIPQGDIIFDFKERFIYGQV